MSAQSTPDASSAQPARPRAQAHEPSMRELLAAAAAASAISTPPSAPPSEEEQVPEPPAEREHGPARAA